MTEPKQKKIAIVVQRCGKGIVAGAEVYTYELAQAIHANAPQFDVDIYTSKSDNYILGKILNNTLRVKKWPFDGIIDHDVHFLFLPYCGANGV